MQVQDTASCPFCSILRGVEPGTIIARDDAKQFAIIKSIHPESIVHWLAIPFEHTDSTVSYEAENAHRFIELFEWSVAQAKQLMVDEPHLERGFTLKTHFGSFETIPHPKIHILAVE
ncbi:MAG: hypothetical protein ACK47M_04155 [Caldilinea sp.]